MSKKAFINPELQIIEIDDYIDVTAVSDEINSGYSLLSQPSGTASPVNPNPDIDWGDE